MVRRERRRPRRTSASSSSATPCSASSSPTTSSARYPDAARGRAGQGAGVGRERRALAEVAAELDLGAALLLGKGEDASGGREKPSILADAMEAVIGAVYLDGGWRRGRATSCCACSATRIDEAAAGPGGQDYKTRLQELAASSFDDAAALRGPRRGPRPRQALLRPRARRRRALRRGRGPLEEAGRAGRGARRRGSR